MNRISVPIRTAGLVVLTVLLGLLVVNHAGAGVGSYQDPTVEPTVRPTATPAPFLELDPTSGPFGAANQVEATGGH